MALWGDGTDLLVARQGSANLTGGAGEDWFVFDMDDLRSNTSITIKDFEAGLDRIVVVNGDGAPFSQDDQGRYILPQTEFQSPYLVVETAPGATRPTQDDFVFLDAMPDWVDTTMARPEPALPQVTVMGPIMFKMEAPRWSHAVVDDTPDDIIGGDPAMDSLL
jgi:hypothetical protein